MLPSGAIFELKIDRSAFAGELKALPQTSSWFCVAASRQWIGGRKGERKEGKEGEGSVPHFFF